MCSAPLPAVAQGKSKAELIHPGHRLGPCYGRAEENYTDTHHMVWQFERVLKKCSKSDV